MASLFTLLYALGCTGNGCLFWSDVIEGICLVLFITALVTALVLLGVLWIRQWEKDALPFFLPSWFDELYRDGDIPEDVRDDGIECEHEETDQDLSIYGEW